MWLVLLSDLNIEIKYIKMQKVFDATALWIPVRSQAITFDAIKACYPLTIKCEPFSLLCCQPEAFPTSLTTMKAKTTLSPHCWHLIWDGQAKAQRHNRFTLSPTTTRRAKPAMLQRASPPERHQSTLSATHLYSQLISLIKFNGFAKVFKLD